MKKLFLLIIGTAIFIVLVGLYSGGKINLSSTSKEVTIGTTKISVELADTSTKRAKGLSKRTALGENSGMLFVIDPKEAEPTFWMKDMLIPLDIIWITGGKITKIDANVPPPIAGTADTALKLYKPLGPVNYVLEVNAGYSLKNNIKVGDTLSL